MWRVPYTLHAVIVIMVAVVVIYGQDSRAGLSGTGDRSGGSWSGGSGGSGHE
jgi:hypothetical protein